jgi:hypothetical protein
MTLEPSILKAASKWSLVCEAWPSRTNWRQRAGCSCKKTSRALEVSETPSASHHTHGKKGEKKNEKKKKKKKMKRKRKERKEKGGRSTLGRWSRKERLYTIKSSLCMYSCSRRGLFPLSRQQNAVQALYYCTKITKPQVAGGLFGSRIYSRIAKSRNLVGRVAWAGLHNSSLHA